MSIYDNVVSGLRFNGIHKKSVLEEAAESALIGAALWDSVSNRLKAHASTLSGGEQFYAALSLALGVADAAQQHTGGVRMDAMFIDEGFGSLDSETLDVAIRALMDLQADGRLVVIISHVEELKTRITSRLEVVKGRNGSTLRWQNA